MSQPVVYVLTTKLPIILLYTAVIKHFVTPAAFALPVASFAEQSAAFLDPLLHLQFSDNWLQF
jgi:hypothetical protein